MGLFDKKQKVKSNTVLFVQKRVEMSTLYSTYIEYLNDTDEHAKGDFEIYHFETTDRKSNPYITIRYDAREKTGLILFNDQFEVQTGAMSVSPKEYMLALAEPKILINKFGIKKINAKGMIRYISIINSINTTKIKPSLFYDINNLPDDSLKPIEFTLVSLSPDAKTGDLFAEAVSPSGDKIAYYIDEVGVKAVNKQKAQAAAEAAKAQAEEAAKAKAAADAAAKAEAMARAEAEAKIKAEAEAKARAEAQELAKHEAEARAKAEALAGTEAAKKAAQEAEAARAEAKKHAEEAAAKAKAEAEARAKAEEEAAAAKAQIEAARAAAKAEAEKARAEAKAAAEAAKAEAKRLAEEEAKRLAEEAKKEAEAAKAEATKKAKAEAEARAKAEEEAAKALAEAEAAKAAAKEEAAKARKDLAKEQMKQMLRDGMPPKLVAKYTGFAEEEVQKVADVMSLLGDL